MLRGIANQQSSKVPSTQHLAFVPVYAVFISIAIFVREYIAGDEFSCVLTLSAIFQTLALCLLVVNALLTGSVQGLSAKHMQLQAIACGCRLSSTTWLLGYLPLDKSGDYLYQSCDALSLVTALCLSYQAMRAQSNEGDTFPVAPFAMVSLILAGLMHADLDNRPVFDGLWLCGVFMQGCVMLPQLWMSAHSSANVPGVLNHFVTVMVISCILSVSYMLDAQEEFTFDTGALHYLAGKSTLVAHALWIATLGGFFCVSLKKLATKGHRVTLEAQCFLEV